MTDREDEAQGEADLYPSEGELEEPEEAEAGKDSERPMLGEESDELEDVDGDEGNEEAEEDEAAAPTSAIYEITDQVFESLELVAEQINDVKETWSIYLKEAASRQAAGEAIYSAIFDAAPSLQSLFKSPRAVIAMRFMGGLNAIVAALHEPKALKVAVETLGFQHLELEVTVPRVVIFREAIIDLLQVEVGPRFTTHARDGWTSLLNYCGGAYIYVRQKYADRLRILAQSWATANNKAHELLEEHQQNMEGSEEEKNSNAGDGEASPNSPLSPHTNDGDPKKGNKKGNDKHHHRSKDECSESDDGALRNVSVPRTFNEMFTFNAAVMGFGGSMWMNEVLASFDTIVSNVSNSYRLQEECDFLSLRIAKYKGSVNLSEYKAVMLASLRSLVPKDWNSNHEVAWGWLWENVERMLKQLMGKPLHMQKALERLWGSLSESQQLWMRNEFYAKFFAMAPAGQDYFKQSTTRLHFICDRVVMSTLEIFKDPKKMVQDLSALGLRHVGYGIPTELFGPFVTAFVQTISELTDDEPTVDAFQWSMSLISRILVRVINEGSTIVMKAINVNNAKQLKKAVGCAPRGKRELWMLNVQVGTQSISPLLWAIETGSVEAARAVIIDLLTIRADRAMYYYGADALFHRHPDIIKRLSADAPGLLPVLLDGLIWRSRTTEKGFRRVNYYIKNLIVDEEGGFAQALEWLVDNNDPKVICHPIVKLVTDFVWSKVAARVFFLRKSWLLFTLIVFIGSHSVLKYLHDGHTTQPERIGNFASRMFIYVFSMGQLLYQHTKSSIRDIRMGRMEPFYCILVPEYWTNWQELASLCLCVVLFAMCCVEPIFYCLNDTHPALGEDFGMFTEVCGQSANVRFLYSVLSMIGMGLYYLMLVDLSVFSNRVSAFVLVCGRVLSEVLLFMAGLFFSMLTFSSAISALDHHNRDYEGIAAGSMSLLEITMGMYASHYEALFKEPVLLFSVIVYVLCTVIFLLNLLIAQLNCAYQSTYQDMLGYARLNRGRIVVESMTSASVRRWQTFVESLRLDQPLEFNEGDIGLAGGIQILEPASDNPTTVDMIRRFGGSTSPSMQWPEDDQDRGNDEEDRFERMEKLLEKAIKRINTNAKKSGNGSTNGSSGLPSGGTVISSVQQHSKGSTGSEASEH